MSIRSRLLTGALAAVSALALITTTAPSASAATYTGGNGSTPSTCAGSYVGGKVARDSAQRVILRLEVFYSSAKSGTNCAILYNNTGKRIPMQLKVESRDFKNYAIDTGNYVSYAGRVAISGTAKKSINIWAGATYQGKSYSLDMPGSFGN